MEFIVAYWWLWLIGLVGCGAISIVLFLITGGEMSSYNTANWAIFTMIGWIVFGLIAVASKILLILSIIGWVVFMLAG